MGMMTDLRAAQFEEETGVVPARGDSLAAIRALQGKCFEAIKLLELERSGIRDGNGNWHGSDAIGSMCRDLIEAAELVASG